MGFYLKSPGAAIDYAVDWGAKYLDGEAVSTSDWSVEPDHAGGLAVQATIHGPERTAATLAGGALGRVYRVKNRVTLSDGRMDERLISIRVDER
ncbi:MAG: hypothetical protein WA906_02250 [Pacificimonas sp.]